ncbi:hypothetical protein PTSG_04791 [Salpingoeca rosetta]|uniref:DUF1214 domain-containing protein n=1 Tax=Salpingoeca rosetta (strain ATCC 50818 / BSB-021) TaxID=946362 RepID=F2U9P9_SALR5|nr:uncharacterized protein PTSG_04791 [Salpingoeca rosetta]EGD73076.1 hypothetical protein PTSG_04791 [Salpingoeca rosetta]|eukprot:XP_004994107.1 hypothetical protein PTSG_04791 [Salpingoeca rosetta]
MWGTLSLAILVTSLIFLFRKGFRSGIFAIAIGYRALVHWYRNLRGLTPDDIHERRIVSGQAWDEFCDAIKAAGAVLSMPGTPQDPFNQAEGYRYLSRLIRGGLENFVECSDPLRPRLNAIANGLRPAPIKLGSDSPDNLYESAVIDGRFTYRLKGTRGTPKILGFGTQAGRYGGDGGLKTVDYKTIDDMVVNADGTFEVYLGPRKPDACPDSNYLRTLETPAEGMLLVRQTFGVRTKETPAQLEIECITASPGGSSSKLTCAALDTALSSAQLFIAGAPAMFAHWAAGFQKHKNQLPLFDQELSNSVGGDPNIRYFHSYWELKDDEALVIEATPPPCKFWNFQLNNHWMESLDYRYFPIHVNKYTAKYKRDGSIMIIVSKEDPHLSQETYTWLSTTDHNCGTMSFRWILPEVDGPDLPHPHTRVESIAQLKETQAH